MKVNSMINSLFVFWTLILSLNCLLEEGNILLPMTSNFTLEHYQNKVYSKNYYTIPLLVGTPEEEYEVQIDTSTATSWIPSSRCSNCIMSHRLYDQEDSRTSSPTDNFVEIEDEDGNVEGYQIADNIKLGSYKLKQFGFVEVTKVADNFKDHYQGKLGLGYKSTLLKDDEFNFLEKLKKHNLIKKKIFTINAINEKKGMLFVGDIPGKPYNSYCNVTNTDDLDEMYQESWVCKMTHIGIFDREKGIFNKIKFYDELKNNKLVSFDSAYDFIAVPMSEKEGIEKLLGKAKLQCTEQKRNSARGEMDMLIKIIDEDDAIWTFGYPFLNQFLMIFNMEEDHVGIKKLKKTALPIVAINNKDMLKYNLGEDSSSSSNVFKVIGYITLLAVTLAILFIVYHAIRKNVPNSKSSLNINEHKVDPIF